MYTFGTLQVHSNSIWVSTALATFACKRKSLTVSFFIISHPDEICRKQDSIVIKQTGSTRFNYADCLIGKFYTLFVSKVCMWGQILTINHFAIIWGRPSYIFFCITYKTETSRLKLHYVIYVRSVYWFSYKHKSFWNISILYLIFIVYLPSARRKTQNIIP